MSTQASRSTDATSGHFFVVSCKFREKTLTDPSLARCAWNRSPSYLCSQVKAFPDSLLRTSSTDLVGLASMGKTGTPTPNAHFVCRFHKGVVSAPWHKVLYDGASA